MEYSLDEYKRSVGNVFTTENGHKYIKSKNTDKYMYLRCVLFRDGCKGSSKLDHESNLIRSLNPHNHNVEKYKTEVYQLKTKCKSVVKKSQTSLRKVFDNVTRNDPSACLISFTECESSLYRARRTLQPKIPLSAPQFVEMLPTTTMGKYYKYSVTTSEQTGVIFFSEQMQTFLNEVTNVQFDGTFYTVPTQFSQLWTIFVSVGRHTLPAIHCLITAKTQELYQAVLEIIYTNVPQFRPLASMSDWEPAARNAFKVVFPEAKGYGCWFHYTQRIWAKSQKLGLIQGFGDNPDIAAYIKLLMAIPFLPSPLISPTFNFLLIPTSIQNVEMLKLEKLRNYCQKRWIRQISPEELSIYEINIATNNGAESYHSKLKSIIRTCHPRIWTFMEALNDIIQDTDNDIGRFRMGREISRPRKKRDINNSERRHICKQKLSCGEYNPMEFIKAISHTIGNINLQDTNYSSDYESSDEENVEATREMNTCVVCLEPRTATWIFMPCRHANCCTGCSQTIEEQGHPCPVCRSTIESRFQIFTS